MIGTIVNTAAILVGSALGATLRKGLREKYRNILFDALGLATIVLGVNAAVSNMPKSEMPVLFILSLAIGGLIGTWWNPSGRIDRWSERRKAQHPSSTSHPPLAEGLTTGCLLFCIGTFSIVGPVLSALEGDNTYLYTNATLDLVTSAVLAATYGYGMMLAAPVLFCWQGIFYLTAMIFRDAMPEAMRVEISIVGGVLILCSGLSILKIRDIKTINLLPALVVPVIYYLVMPLFTR